MDGKTEIVGHTIIRVKNGYIKMPEFADVKPGDILCARLDPYITKIIISTKEELENHLCELKMKMDIARQEGRLSYTQYHRLLNYCWGILCLHERKINANNEFMIYSKKYEDQAEQRQIRKLNLKDEVIVVGVDKHLEIYPSEEAYLLTKIKK